MLVLRSPEEEAIEEDSRATVFLNGASSGGANGFTSKELSAAAPWCSEDDGGLVNVCEVLSEGASPVMDTVSLGLSLLRLSGTLKLRFCGMAAG